MQEQHQDDLLLNSQVAGSRRASVAALPVGELLVSEPDPRKIEKEGLVFRMGWKCTLRPVCRRTSDWLLINILMCVYWNANRTIAVFAFCFVLESCKHQAGKIRTLLRVSGSAESSTGYGRFRN